ncbi:MAG: hypothetical protein ACREOF_07920 [Gemmatimonadales bacterium]
MRPTIYVPSRLLKLLPTPASPAGETLAPIPRPAPDGPGLPEIGLSPRCRRQACETAAA